MPKPFTSIEKAIDILCVFDLKNQELSARDISDSLNIPLSSTYKYLDLLLKKGFISKEPDTKKFSLGLTVYKMGNLAAARISFIDIAQPHMRSLAKESGETVTLTVINGWEALCVEVIESSKIVKWTVKRGASIPLHAGASSKILLAYQDNTFIDDMVENAGLPALNENTLTEPEKLKEELKNVRDKGYALSNSEVEAWAGAIAAPIFNHKGKLVAGLTIVGPPDRIFNEESGRLIEMTRHTAEIISSELGS